MAARSKLLCLLVGVPGKNIISGIAAVLEKEGWTVVSEDLQGSLSRCRATCAQALRNGSSVVIDRCNGSRSERAGWLQLADEYQALTVAWHPDSEVALKVEKMRYGHATALEWGERSEETLEKIGNEERQLYDEVIYASNKNAISKFLNKYANGRDITAASKKEIRRQAARCRDSHNINSQNATHGVSVGKNSKNPHYKSMPAPWETVLEIYNQLRIAAKGSGIGPRDFPGSTIDPQQDAEPSIRQLSADAAPAPEFLRVESDPRKRKAEELQLDYPQQKAGRQWIEGQPADSTANSMNQMRHNVRRATRRSRKAMERNAMAIYHPDMPLDVLPMEDAPPVLLFDLNGTLTSHTFQRKSAGVNRIRPGIRHLRRLQEKFRLGIYSSASTKTVSEVLPMLEKAAGDGLALFAFPGLILTRNQTMEAPAHHREAGGNAWDTVKPLAKHFQNLHQVLLVDDDAYKACEGEETNMIVLPRWEESDDDKVIEWFVDAILAATEDMSQNTDLREVSTAISDSIRAKYNQPASDQAETSTHLLEKVSDEEKEQLAMERSALGADYIPLS